MGSLTATLLIVFIASHAARQWTHAPLSRHDRR